VILDRLVDLHVHSAASGQGLELPALLELADRRGVRIGVADHVGAEHALASDARLHEHLDELADYPVLKAIELELADEPFALSRDLLGRLDYVVGGLHELRVGPRTVSLVEPGRLPHDPDEVVQAVVDRLVAAMEQEPLDVLAHPTLLPPALRGRAAELFHDDHLDRLGRTAAECGVALEMTGRLRLPHEGAVLRWLAAGATLAIGSAGREPAEVGELAYPLDLVERFRIGSDRLFRGD
jgi:histidinol phosphatase-like PHP family hydrolase